MLGHLRRRFIDTEKVAPEIAREAIEMIRMLYAVEKQARNVSAGERLALRQAESAPVLAQIRQKLLLWKEQLLPKHSMAEAINYALSQWREMNVFCSDGAVAIDNNASEREMKRVILNRKNSPFVGNPRGGKTAAILASLTSTCRRHDIHPQLYLTQLLTNLSTTCAATSLTGYRTNGSSANNPAWQSRNNNPRTCASHTAHLFPANVQATREYPTILRKSAFSAGPVCLFSSCYRAAHRECLAAAEIK